MVSYCLQSGAVIALTLSLGCGLKKLWSFWILSSTLTMRRKRTNTVHAAVFHCFHSFIPKVLYLSVLNCAFLGILPVSVAVSTLAIQNLFSAAGMGLGAVF